MRNLSKKVRGKVWGHVRVKVWWRVKRGCKRVVLNEITYNIRFQAGRYK